MATTEGEKNDRVNANESNSTDLVILEAELEFTQQELYSHQETKQYQRTHYSVSSLSSEVIRVETGLPTKEVFTILVEYTAQFKEPISYYAGWKVKSMVFDNQIFLTLMKLCQTTPICSWLNYFLVAALQQFLTLPQHSYMSSMVCFLMI